MRLASQTCRPCRQWPASLGRHWLWPTYPQKLWITLFMKLGDQAVARANTGLQGLFKKYRIKIVSIKIK
ncbi:hypothetical protein CX648_16010 [Aeromonas dhakensis]|nr:hypothetical protein CX648_16010 [Aeromonas dhakensis]